jgi:hypothetical protein
MVDKKLKNRGMEIGLKNAVSAVQGAVCPHMENHVTATVIMAGSRAFPYETPLVSGDKEGGFSGCSRIICSRYPLKNLAVVLDNRKGNIQTRPDHRRKRGLCRVFVDIQV